MQHFVKAKQLVKQFDTKNKQKGTGSSNFKQMKLKLKLRLSFVIQNGCCSHKTAANQ